MKPATKQLNIKTDPDAMIEKHMLDERKRQLERSIQNLKELI